MAIDDQGHEMAGGRQDAMLHARAAEQLEYLLWTSSRYRWTPEGCRNEAVRLLADWFPVGQFERAGAPIATPPHADETGSN